MFVNVRRWVEYIEPLSWRKSSDKLAPYLVVYASYRQRACVRGLPPPPWMPPLQENDDDDVGSISEVPTRFRFDIPSVSATRSRPRSDSSGRPCSLRGSVEGRPVSQEGEHKDDARCAQGCTSFLRTANVFETAPTLYRGVRATLWSNNYGLTPDC